jgi:hypothetical protein
MTLGVPSSTVTAESRDRFLLPQGTRDIGQQRRQARPECAVVEPAPKLTVIQRDPEVDSGVVLHPHRGDRHCTPAGELSEDLFGAGAVCLDECPVQQVCGHRQELSGGNRLGLVAGHDNLGGAKEEESNAADLRDQRPRL